MLLKVSGGDGGHDGIVRMLVCLLRVHVNTSLCINYIEILIPSQEYRSVPHIRSPSRMYMHRYFYLANSPPPQPWPCYQNQPQNEASVHRTAKEFGDDRKRVCEWCQCYSTLKGQTHGELGKCHYLRCGQPLSVDLDHRVSGMSTSRCGPGRGGVFAR